MFYLKKRPSRLNILLMIGILVTAINCNQIGDTCYSTGGNIDECFTGWTPAECQNWNNLKVNGATWQSSIMSCYDLGFSIQCSSSTRYVHKSSDCP